MVDDPDLWRAANLFAGAWCDASLVAAKRADELLAEGNTDGCAVWRRIHKAVAELSRAEPVKGERVN